MRYKSRISVMRCVFSFDLSIFLRSLHWLNPHVGLSRCRSVLLFGVWCFQFRVLCFGCNPGQTVFHCRWFQVWSGFGRCRVWFRWMSDCCVSVDCLSIPVRYGRDWQTEAVTVRCLRLMSPMSSARRSAGRRHRATVRVTVRWSAAGAVRGKSILLPCAQLWA